MPDRHQHATRPGRLFELSRVFCDDRRGAALIETTLLMPFLLFACAGVFEFGNLFYQKLLVEAGVRDAARYVARCTWPSLTACVTTGEEIAVFGEPGGSDPRVDGFTTGDVDIDQTYRETANTADEDGNYPYRGGPII